MQALNIREVTYPDGHPMILSIHNNIAQVYSNEGKYDEAIDLYEQVIQGYSEKMFCKEERDSTFLATVYDNVSVAYRFVERYDEAISACKKGRDMRRIILGEESADYALSLNNLALIYYYMQEYGKAKELFENALNIKKQVLPEIHGDLSLAHFNLGLVQDKLCEDENALENYRLSMEIDNELGAYEDVLFTAKYMADIYERNGMLEEAEIYRSLGS